MSIAPQGALAVKDIYIMAESKEPKTVKVIFTKLVHASNFSYKEGETGEILEADAEFAIKEGYAVKA